MQVDENNVVSWYNFIREVCSADLVAIYVQLGVAVDETMDACRKQRDVQGCPIHLRWVFSSVVINTGDFFMEIVSRHDATSLHDATSSHPDDILPGTHIWSDEWWAYQQLPQLGYVPETVNCQFFVNLAAGVHTNNRGPLVGMQGILQAPLQSDTSASSIVP